MDLRHSLEGREKGDERARLGIDVFVRRVRKYLGAYFTHLGGKVDAVVFSAGAGAGEGLRKAHVKYLGAHLGGKGGTGDARM